MLKEILKGNKNPSKEKSAEKKQRNRRINSVLNNFDLFKKINLNKKGLQKNDKVNSFKLIIKNSTKIKQKQINSNKLKTSPYSRNKNNNLLINNSCTFKRSIDKLNSISNFKSYNFDTYEYMDMLNEKNLISTYNLRNNEIDGKENQNGNQNLYERKSNVYLNSAKNGDKLFINNLEKEIEIRCLKKKLKNLKNKNKSLIQQLDNIKEKNNKIKTQAIEEQNKRKDIICSFINIYNDIFNNEEEDDDESNKFKFILLNLMNLKYKYENILLENEFISSVGTLFSLSNIFNDNFYDNKRNNNNNNLYYNIKNIIKLKVKYLNCIKKYKLLQTKNKKYFTYCSNLLKEFNLNDLDTLYNTLNNIKSINDNETRKYSRMKKVLFNSINHNNRRRNINKSVDNLKKLKKYPINFNFNFNYSDLQKYFIEHNKNKKYIKERYMTLKTEKSDCLTEREREREREKEKEEEGEEEGFRFNKRNICNNTIKNESRNVNYFLGGNIKSLRNINKDKNNNKKMCIIKNYVKNVDKIKHQGLDNDKEKGSKSSFFNSITKRKEAPYNNILIKKNNQNINYENIINSKIHSNSNEIKSEEKVCNSRLKKFYNHALKNKLNNTINTNIFNVKKIFNSNLKDNSKKRKNKSEKNNSYNNNIKIKKKSLKIRANKNYY